MLSVVSLIIRGLSWLAVPVGIICVIEDWWRRPARRLKVGGEPPTEPTMFSFCYRVLPILIVVAVLRIFTSESINFSALLVLIAVVTGLVWLLDALLLAPRRRRAAATAGVEPAAWSAPGHSRLRAELLPCGPCGGAAALVSVRALPYPF